MKNKNMKVVILCGGMGTRLMEKTQYGPKAMVKIGNKPILWHIMNIYSHYGYNDFVLCLGYMGDVIKSYFHNYKVINNDFTIELDKPEKVKIYNKNNEKGWNVTLVDTGENALKGCRIKRIQKYINTDLFMLTYADGVANININGLLKFHKSHGRIATVTGVRPPSRFGELVVQNNKVISFMEKPQVSKGLINGGFFVLSKKIFDCLSDSESCDFEMGALEKLAENNELMMYKHDGEWACMDTLRDMNYLNKLYQEGKAFWKVW